MKKAFAILCYAVAVTFCFAQTLETKDREHPNILVNDDPSRTDLRLKVVAPVQVTAGSECEIRVELHNEGYRIEVIYMPALTMLPKFKPQEKGNPMVADEFGPPMVFGRGAAKDEGLNYVVLMGGDYYGRTYRWKPPTSGTVTFAATYKNSKAGPNGKLRAWRGELKTESSK